MAFMVDMEGGEPGTPDDRSFSCYFKVWDQSLEIARNHGWQPMDTTPDPNWYFMKWGTEEYGPFPGGYKCKDFGKVVSAPDASALADALERAAQQGLPPPQAGPLLIQEGATSEEHQQANAPLSPAFIKEFVSFLRKGEFSFYWDD